MKKVFSILLILIIMLGLVGCGSKKNNNKDNSDNSAEEYIYKIRFDFGNERYIYLLPNNIIKTLSIQEIYEVVPNCNCLEPTGEYEYTEEIINFSDDTKKKVIDVFDELYKESGKKEINADDMELTKYQLRILLAITLNDEDEITIDDDIEYEKEEKNILLNDNYKKVNTKISLKNNTKNKIVNKIANYLNKIIDEDFEYYNNYSLIDNEELFDNKGVNLKIELAYIGPYSISFIYTKEGILDDKIYDIKGYNFHYNGNIYEFDMNGWKSKYHEKAIEKFKQNDLYFKYRDKLYNNWEQIIYENMFLTGNWYLSNDEIVFLIKTDLLGSNISEVKVINISVPVDEDF